MGKRSSSQYNNEAIRILDANEVNILAAFIIDPGYDEEDFKELFDYIESIQISFPRVAVYPRLSILTPLPGTELYEQKYDDLITFDLDLYDTLHAILPTKLEREDFYRQFALAWKKSIAIMVKGLMNDTDKSLPEERNIDPALVHRLLQGSKKLSRYTSFLKDEEGRIASGKKEILAGGNMQRENIT